MCALQTYFITCIFGTKQADAAAPYHGLSGKQGGKASAAAATSKDAQKQQSDVDDKSIELV